MSDSEDDIPIGQRITAAQAAQAAQALPGDVIDLSESPPPSPHHVVDLIGEGDVVVPDANLAHQEVADPDEKDSDDDSGVIYAEDPEAEDSQAPGQPLPDDVDHHLEDVVTDGSESEESEVSLRRVRRRIKVEPAASARSVSANGSVESIDTDAEAAESELIRARTDPRNRLNLIPGTLDPKNLKAHKRSRRQRRLPNRLTYAPVTPKPVGNTKVLQDVDEAGCSNLGYRGEAECSHAPNEDTEPDEQQEDEDHEPGE